MFGILKAALGVVTLPIDLAADAINQVGSIGEPHGPASHTKRKAKSIMRNLHEASE